jgi:hypothetical protein
MGVPRLLEAMWGASDFYFDTVSQVHMDGWSSGRVVLVGDASYCPSPMAGVGTSLALVGAYVLAGELATASGDHRRAFVRYEEEMLDYVKQGQKLAKGDASGLIPGSRLQIRLRNQIIRMLPYLPWKGLIAGGAQKAANAITRRSISLRYQDDPRHLHPRHRRHARLRNSRTRRDPFSIRLLTRLCQRTPAARFGYLIFPLFAGLLEVAGPGFEPGTP